MTWHRSLAAVALIGALVGCGGGEETPAAQAEAKKPLAYVEQGNLLTIARGAVVIERTGELDLSNTPVQALDASIETAWTTPPADVEQSFTVVLPALTTAERFVVSNGPGNRAVKSLQIDYSTDGGASFRSGMRVASLAASNGVALDVTPPVSLSALRVSIVEAAYPTAPAASLLSFEMRGKATTPPATPDPSGTWQVNEKTLKLRRDGRRLEGVIEGSLPFHVDGSIDGNVVRFFWTRVNQAGYGLMSVDPSGSRLNALVWYEHPIDLFSAPTWFGQKASDDASFTMPPAEKMVATGLSSMKRYSSFNVRFSASGELEGSDSLAQLERIASFVKANPKYRFRLVSLLFTDRPAAADKQTTDARAAAMTRHLASKQLLAPNLEVVSSGGSVSSDPPRTAVDRPLFDRVDLEVVGQGS